MKLSEKILEILEEKREIEISELIKQLNAHPGVVRKVMEEVRRLEKIEISKNKNPHRPKKYSLIVKIKV